MHLDSLTIQNFRIFDDLCTINYLGQINLIVGKNNSGKSTVLEAIALLVSGFETTTVQKLADIRSANRYITANQREFSLSIQSFFPKFLKQDFSKKIYLGCSHYYLEFGYNSSLDPEDYNYFNEYLDKNFSEDIGVGSNWEFSKINKDKQKYIPICDYEYVNTNPINIDELAYQWDKIVLTDAEDLVIKMLNIIDDKIVSLAFLSINNIRTPFVRLKNRKDRVQLHEMGDGIFKLLQIILKVIKASEGILLIDEFENGLHYSVQPKVWQLIFELAKRFNIQVFATTHSWDCIESFAQVAKERDDLDGVLFRMGRSARKSDEGKVIATVYDEDELYNITKTKMEVR